MAERMTLTEEKTFKVTYRYGNGHRGIDLNINLRGIAKPPILLPEKGVEAIVDVVDNGSIEKTYGNWIQLTFTKGAFKGYWMRTCHMLEMSPLKKGQIVKAGDIIGYQGNTGRSTGAHVHFEFGRPTKAFIPWNMADLLSPCELLDCPAVEGTYQNTYSVNTASTPSLSFTKYNVKPTAKLNIRKGAGVGFASIGFALPQYEYTVLEVNGNWGRTFLGWICLDYTRKV